MVMSVLNGNTLKDRMIDTDRSDVEKQTDLTAAIEALEALEAINIGTAAANHRRAFLAPAAY